MKHIKGLGFYIILFVIIIFIVALNSGTEKPKTLDYAKLLEEIKANNISELVLEGENAIAKVRETMGATNFKDAAPGTIRADFATDIERNVAHGSDSVKSADYEIPFFFSSLDLY